MSAIIRSWDAVHPIALPLFIQLSARLQGGFNDGSTKTQFMVFETYRTPERQNELFQKKKTKARAWQSAHQYGLGIDLVPFDKGQWSWAEDHDYAYLKFQAEQLGLLVPVVWDRCHIQHPAWDEVRRVL